MNVHTGRKRNGFRYKPRALYRCSRFRWFFFNEVQRISKWHKENTAEIEYTNEEIRAGFDEIGERYEFKALIMSLINYDLTKIDVIRRKYLYEVLETVQMKSWEIKAQRELIKIRSKAK